MRIISGKYKGKKLHTPETDDIRPTSDRTRESVFNSLIHNYLPKHLDMNNFNDVRLLDCFAGSGAFGLEAYSRGAKSVMFFDNSPDSIKLLKENINLFNNTETIGIKNIDATKAPVNTYDKYNMIFLDPPYNKELVVPTLEKLESGDWIADDCLVIIEKDLKEEIALPNFIEVLNEKKYGKTKILYCMYK